jgi:hypothetical protein
MSFQGEIDGLHALTAAGMRTVHLCIDDMGRHLTIPATLAVKVVHSHPLLAECCWRTGPWIRLMNTLHSRILFRRLA